MAEMLEMMASAISAGLLPYRWHAGLLQVFLVHPGGPYWEKRDEGAWQIAKGGALPGEALHNAALREFEEEVGARPAGKPWPLARLHQAGGKWIEAYAIEGDLDPADMVSNDFEVEWPPRSGRIGSFPEIDKAAWFTLAEARGRILASQAPLLAALEEAVCRSEGDDPPDACRKGTAQA